MIVKPGQSLVDMAIETYGSINALIDLAFANGASLTDDLTAGQELKGIDFETTEREIVDFYLRKEIHPATALRTVDETELEYNDPCDLCRCFT